MNERLNRLSHFAHEQRQNPSPAELAILDDMRALGFHWQYVLEPFIVDFFHPTLKLVIEVDGKFHTDQKIADAKRTAYLLTHYRVRVARFSGRECFEGVALPAIKRICERMPKLKAKRMGKKRKRYIPTAPISAWSMRASRGR